MVRAVLFFLELLAFIWLSAKFKFIFSDTGTEPPQTKLVREAVDNICEIER